MGKHLILRIVLGIVGFLLLVSVGVFSTYKITSVMEHTSTSRNPNSTTVSPIGTTLLGGSTSSVINHGVCNFTMEPIICDGNLTLTEQTHGFYVEIQNRLSHLNSQYSDFTIRSFEEQNMMFLDGFKPGANIRHGITIETMGSLTNYTNTINNCLDIAQKYQPHATRDMGNIWYENVNIQVKVSNAIHKSIDLYVQIKSKVIHSQIRRDKIIRGMNGCLHVLLNQTYICFEDFTFYETNEMLSQVLDILENKQNQTEIVEVIHADSGERGTNTTRLLRRRAALGIHHQLLTSKDALRQPNTTDMKVKESATIIGDNSEVSGSLQVSVLPQPTHRIRHWRKKVSSLIE